LQILEQCTEIVAPTKDDILGDLAKIAGQPLDRYGVNIKAQQRAKSTAFSVLRGDGKKGQEILRQVAGIGK
jgi:hypothetical protein